ncbi:sensor histidine kinase [Leucobacter sp. wl10]|uniref:sensor histidine kinase n=1 Tax=Leucobacter sp. wl10 TaxID=2304677 RepID=UPI0013C30666|nr:sensor histidine kinase [Leucobacter sp. wl10]
MTKVMILRAREGARPILKCVTGDTSAQRPVLMNVAFWSVYGMTALSSLWGAFAAGFPLEWTIHAINIVLVGLLWFTLRWEPNGGARSLLPAGVFIAASFSLGITGSFGEHALLPLIGFANLAFIASLRATIAVVVFLAGVLGVSSFMVFDNSVETSIRLTLTVLGTAAFVVSLGLAIRRARKRESEAVVLAGRIQELTLAEERARMSREIHDSVGHHLTVVTMNLENAELLKEKDPEAAWAQISDAKSTVRSALTDTRRWVRSLNPTSLQQGITHDSLRAFAATLAGAGVTLNIDISGEPQPLDDDTQLMLYRALQEGVTNAIRHAGATLIDVELRYEREDARLVIRNDGTAGAGTAEGFGLMSLRQRVAEKGGSLSFDLRDDPQLEAILSVEVPTPRRSAR